MCICVYLMWFIYTNMHKEILTSTKKISKGYIRDWGMGSMLWNFAFHFVAFNFFQLLKYLVIYKSRICNFKANPSGKYILIGSLMAH